MNLPRVRELIKNARNSDNSFSNCKSLITIFFLWNAIFILTFSVTLIKMMNIVDLLMNNEQIQILQYLKLYLHLVTIYCFNFIKQKIRHIITLQFIFI